MGEDVGEEEDQGREERDAVKAEQEKYFANKMLAKKKHDGRYGPSYERIIVLDSDRYNMGQEVDFLEGCRGKAVDSEEKLKQTYKMTSTVNGELVGERKSGLNPDYISADNMTEFLAVNNAELKAAAKPAEEKPVMPSGATPLSPGLPMTSRIESRSQETGCCR